MARRNHRKNTPVRRGSVWPRVLFVAVLGIGGLLLWNSIISRPSQPSTPLVQTQPRPTQTPQPAQTPSSLEQSPTQTAQPAPRNPVISVKPLETPPQPKPETPTPPTPEQPKPEARAEAQSPSPAPLSPSQEQSSPPLTYIPETDSRPNANNPLVNPTPNTRVKIQGQPDGLILRRAAANEADKVIALTFDDGPNLEFTPQVLEILEKYNAKATFFWVGRELERNPDTAKAVLAAGHATGNHTWTHRTAPTGDLEAERELEATQQQLEQVGGSGRLFRPPGGRLKNGLSDWALRHNYTVVMWSAQSNDWEPGVTETQIVQNVLGAAQPGAIVLLHDGGGDRSRTIAALPKILEGLQAQGYRFVTIPEMLATMPIQQ